MQNWWSQANPRLGLLRSAAGVAMSDPRPEMKAELHHLVELVSRKLNGIRALSILIDQATVLAEYKSTRGSIQFRAAKSGQSLRARPTGPKNFLDRDGPYRPPTRMRSASANSGFTSAHAFTDGLALR